MEDIINKLNTLDINKNDIDMGKLLKEIYILIDEFMVEGNFNLIEEINEIIYKIEFNNIKTHLNIGSANRT